MAQFRGAPDCPLPVARPRRRRAASVWPIGASRTRSDARIYMVGVDTARTRSTAGCHRQSGAELHPFPDRQRVRLELCSRNWTAKPCKRATRKAGRISFGYCPPGKANEVLDTAVYALAARHATRVRLDLLRRPAKRRRTRRPIRRKARHRLLRTFRRIAAAAIPVAPEPCPRRSRYLVGRVELRQARRPAAASRDASYRGGRQQCPARGVMAGVLTPSATAPPTLGRGGPS